MKKCLKCNRTYSDQSLNFCLDDGTALVSDSDRITDENIQRQTEQATEILSYDQVTQAYPANENSQNKTIEQETIVESQTAENNTSQPQIIKQGVSPVFAYLTVGLLTLLVLIGGIGVIFWINSKSNKEVTAANSASNSPISFSNLSESNQTVSESIIKKKDTKTPKTDTKKETPKPTKSAKPKPTATAQPTKTPDETPKPTKGKFFVILGSFPQTQSAKAKKRLQLARSRGLGARIVNTNNVAALRNGLLAVVMGPFSKSSANNALRRAKSVSPDAYIKSAPK